MLYAVLTYIGAIFIFFCFPELKGRSIESMDDLFQRSLWTMWKHAYPTEEEKTRQGVQQRVEKGGETDSVSFDTSGQDPAEKGAVTNHVEKK